MFQAFYTESTKVRQVDVPTGTGFIGILASHVPTFGVLKPGVLTVMETEGAINKFFGMGNYVFSIYIHTVLYILNLVEKKCNLKKICLN